jgi:CRISPR system Cascade subunit CasD
MAAYRYLLLWFEGPLQSWGADSKFGRRDTLFFPTKSGVLGLICAALGASGEQRELLEEMAPREQVVISYALPRRNRDGTIGGKADRETLLRDFHMVGAGYDDSDPWQNLHIPKKADGGKAVGGGSKMTYRYYLQDAKFAVIVEVPARKAELFAEALQNPVFDIYLGRKNCVPAEKVFQALFDTREAALAEAGVIAGEKGLLEDFQVIPGKKIDRKSFTISDVPLQFGQIKKYRDRVVTVIYTDQDG